MIFTYPRINLRSHKINDRCNEWSAW